MSAILSEKRGGHKYDDKSGTSDCEFRCGCWMGGTQSGGQFDPFGKCPNNPANTNPPKAGPGKLLSNKRYWELRMQSFNSMHRSESGELTSERTFVVKSIIGHHTGQIDDFIYVRDTDDLLWELPLTAKHLAVRGRRVQVTMTRRIKVESVESEFKGAVE
jgi:hypothetical protein